MRWRKMAFEVRDVALAAAKESQQNLGLMRLIQRLDINYLGCRLRGLACETGEAKTKVPEDILSSFFSAPALAYLLELPNHYCFWTIVKAAAMGGAVIPKANCDSWRIMPHN